MSIEGTCIYACPIPGEPSQDPRKITITTLASTYPDQDYVQGLINTVAQQREELEVAKEEIVILKKAVTFARVLMTSAQHESLRNLMMLLVGEKT